MINRNDQRIGVFIDVQNLYYSAKNLYSQKVNFGEVLKTVVGNRKLIRAFAYVVKADNPDEQKFFEALGSRCCGFGMDKFSSEHPLETQVFRDETKRHRHSDGRYRLWGSRLLRQSIYEDAKPGQVR